MLTVAREKSSEWRESVMPHRRPNALIRRSSDPTRQDLLTAERLEVALQFQIFLGPDAALSYLQANKVNQDLAIRVLFDPKKRRTPKSRFRSWVLRQVWRVLRKLYRLIHKRT